ncbi:GntR family transcriptional regulator [Granulicella sp. dw_53]|uniref:GntR family transcriptional regulator n=1 Tax=Granulicella sp. dw_53 TaxID=2719792 RepID=UPI001BD5C550|nr:GntR family transcriptional regulator [Granulicella sp. dw_53]
MTNVAKVSLVEKVAIEELQKLSAPKNLTALAYESIKRHILEGKLEHDVRLTEEFLSQQLGISKSPVREALNGLQNEGLIRIEPRRGAYLRKFSIKEIEDLYNLREALESYAVSIVKISPQLIEDLRSSIKRTSKFLKADDKIRHIEEDMEFHGTIARATENMELSRILANIQNQIWLFRCQTYDLSSSSAPLAHMAILTAFEERNKEQAVVAMQAHIGHVRGQLISFLRQSAK